LAQELPIEGFYEIEAYISGGPDPLDRYTRAELLMTLNSDDLLLNALITWYHTLVVPFDLSVLSSLRLLLGTTYTK